MKKFAVLLGILVVLVVALLSIHRSLAHATTSLTKTINDFEDGDTMSSQAIVGETSVITPGILTFHDADATIAYNWFTYVPETISKTERSYIWITGLHGNLITDNYDEITAESQQQADWKTSLADEHKFIMLVPVIPRPATNHVYAVAFDWKVFLDSTDPFCQRPDLKVNLMIDQFISDLRNDGYNVDDKVFVDGFSAGAMFAQRYALLHPERVHAIAAGQCGGAMTLPESVYTDTIATQMDWPVGVYDFSPLVGYEFDQDAYRQVAQFIYIGDQDTTNSTLWGPGELWRTQSQIDFLNSTFGYTDPVRLENQASYLVGLDYDVTFKLYPGIGHQFTSEMINDTFSFFHRVMYPNQTYLPIVARGYAAPALPIEIDGESGDWQPYTPIASDPQGDTTGGSHTDLKAVFAETGPSYAYLMVESYDPPLLSEATIELNMDLVDSEGETWMLHTNINSNGSFFGWVDTDGDGEWEEYPITGELLAWGNVMELRIPLQQLGNPTQMNVTLVNFWCEVEGEWTWVDMIIP
jgi:pimeloyl-ACP methyl ester carboxylesterase